MRERLANLLTVTRWMRGYDRGTFLRDALSGLTVGVMLVPQAMAYAMLAGLPPIYGLYASTVPLLIYPLLGTSRRLAFGIVAIDCLIIQSALAQLGPESPMEAGGLAVTLAFLAGAMHTVMGALRLGFVVDFLSRPVIAGFMLAAPIVIGLSQLRHLLGIDILSGAHVLDILWAVGSQLGETHAATAALGFGSIAALFFLKRVHKLFPRALVTIGIATLVVWLADVEGVARVGHFEAGLPEPRWPLVSLETARRLIPSAFALAMMQLMTVTSLGKSLAAEEAGPARPVEPNREMIAVGIANVSGSFFGSMPVSASFSRTAVNVEAGGETPAVNWVASGLVVMGLIFLEPVLAEIPIPTLAAIIMVSAFGMVSLMETRDLFRILREEGWVALTTTAVTLLIGIEEGVLFGILASMTVMLYKYSRPRVAELGRLPGTRAYRDRSVLDQLEGFHELLILRVDGSMSFTNTESIRRAIMERVQAEGEILDCVILDGRGINELDATAVEGMHALLDTLEENRVNLFMTNVKKRVRDILERGNLTERLGSPDLAATTDEVVCRLDKRAEDRATAEDGADPSSTPAG